MLESVLLVVDDDESRRRTRIDALRGAGFQTVGASSATSALQCARRHPSAVVLLSGRLPDLGLAELSRQLRAQAPSPLILSLASAASPTWEGADLYLREPLAPQELIATVSTCLRLRQCETEVDLGVVRPDGAECRISGRGEAKRDAQGRITGLRGTLRNLTGQQRAREELDRRLAEIEAIYNTAPVGLCVLDPDGRYLRINRCLADTNGFSIEEHPGKTVREVVPHLAGAVESVVRRVIETGEPVLGLEMAERTDSEPGAPRYFLTHWHPLKQRSATYAVNVVIEEITDRKRMEEALRASEERLRFVLAYSQAGAWELDLTTGTFIFSDETYSLFGFDRDLKNPREADWLALIHPEDRGWIEQAWRHDKQQTAGPAWVEYRILHPERGVRWISGWAGLKRDEAGQLTRVGGISFDITDKKQTEEALRESEERLRFVLASAKAGAWEMDVRRRVFLVSEEINVIFGLDRGNAILAEEDWLNLLHPEDRLWIEQAWRQDQAQGAGEFCVEYRILNPERGLRWIKDWGEIRRDDQGRLSRVGGICVDITDQKREEEKIRFQARLLDAVEQAIVVFDREGHVTYWNRFAERLYGWRAEEARGRHGIELLAPEFTEARPGELLALLNSGEPVTGELTVRHRNGHAIPLLSTGSPVFDEQECLSYVIGISIDITERKQAEEALREADRQKDEFLATLAHELRNPLAPICNGLQILRLSRNDPKAMDDTLDMLQRQVQQMVRLIDDLLDIRRISQGKIELRKTAVDLATIVQYAVETSQPLMVRSGHEFRIDLPSESIRVEADLIRLAQALANLLNNAAKYTPSGGRITLGVELEGHETLVRVQDNGIGIPASMLGKVFDLFAQVDRSLEKAQGGLGIGLSLVKRLVELHGGTVEAHSEGLGKGSEFVVRLPVLEASEGLEENPYPQEEAASISTTHRVLIVDDNADSEASMAWLLECMGHEVRRARNGLEAIEVAGSFRPRLILMDIGMPQLNGYEACRRLRAEPWGRDMVIAALTGWGQDQDQHRAQKAGFDHYFVKPIDHVALKRLLDSLSRETDGSL